jgi:hypothetical protein
MDGVEETTNGSEIPAEEPAPLPRDADGAAPVAATSHLASSMQNVKAHNEAHKVLAACEG